MQKYIALILATVGISMLSACTITRHDDVRNPSYQTKTWSIAPAWATPSYSEKEEK